MNALEALRITLVGHFSLPTQASGPTTALSQTLARLRQMRQRRTGSRTAPQVTQALFQLRMGGPPTRTEGLGKLCASLCRSTGWDQRRPLDDLQLLAALFRHVESLAAEPGGGQQRFSRCYRALLTSFFSLPATEVEDGHAGWKQLGEFLRRHHESACRMDPTFAGKTLLPQCAPLIGLAGQNVACSPELRRQLCLRLGVAADGWLNREN